MLQLQSNGTTDGSQQYAPHPWNVEEFYINRFYRGKWNQFLKQK